MECRKPVAKSAQVFGLTCLLAMPIPISTWALGWDPLGVCGEWGAVHAAFPLLPSLCQL